MFEHIAAGTESDFSFELAQFELEKAVLEKFPEDECAFCGSDQGIKLAIVNSHRLLKPRDLPICKICRALMIEMEVEDYFKSIQDENPFLWSLIVIHNMRKINWISRSVFAVLKERRDEVNRITT